MELMSELIGNITTIKTGKLDVNAENPNGKYPFFTCSKNHTYIDKYAFEGESILVAGNGDLNVKYYDGKFNAYQRTYVIQPKKSLNGKYLYYFLEKYVEKLREQSIGGVIKYIKLGNLTDAKIPLPDLPTQQKIATILDKADELRQYNQQLIDKYNALINSLFLEMFGDMAHNHSKFVQVPLIDLVADKHDIKCGPFGTQLSKSEYVEYGVPIWGIPQINSRFEKKPTEYITIQKAEILKQYSVLPNDLIMSRKGNVGKCAIYPNWEMGILHSDALRIRCDKDKIIPIFLAWQFRISRSLETQVNDVSSGAIMAGINVSKLKNIKPIVPPIDLQNQFAERVQLIEAQKQQAQEALAKSEALFQGLLQQAFKGELN